MSKFGYLKVQPTSKWRPRLRIRSWWVLQKVALKRRECSCLCWDSRVRVILGTNIINTMLSFLMFWPVYRQFWIIRWRHTTNRLLVNIMSKVKMVSVCSPWSSTSIHWSSSTTGLLVMCTFKLSTSARFKLLACSAAWYTSPTPGTLTVTKRYSTFNSDILDEKRRTWGLVSACDVMLVLLKVPRPFCTGSAMCLDTTRLEWFTTEVTGHLCHDGRTINLSVLSKLREAIMISCNDITWNEVPLQF